MEQEIRFCTTPDGAHIAYGTMGQGPALVFPPAWISHLEVMLEDPACRAFFEGLARHHTFVWYDKRGCGLSDRDRTDFSLQAELGDLEAVIEHLKLERLALFGVSQGGPLAVAYATKHSQRVTHLILYGAYAKGDTIAKDEVKASLLSLVRAHWGLGSKTLADIFVPHGDAAAVEGWDRFQRESATAKMAADMLAANYQLDITDLLPSVSVPTLVMHRQKDRAMPFRLGRELAASINNAHFVPLEGNIHLPWLGDSDSILQAIGEFLGDPITTETGRLLVTVLFTDIVRSTEKAAELGDERWRDLLERHRVLIRKELSRFQGSEMDATGDGFLATFEKPAQAIRCAYTISDSIRELGIEVRVGLHMGECEATGKLVSGVIVHTGARVAAKASPGEVLVSSTVKDAVAGSDFRFEDKGVHDLKGIPGELRLFAVERGGGL